MTGRRLTEPIPPRCPGLQWAHPRNRLPLKNRSRTPTAAYGTNAQAIRIRRYRSQTPQGRVMYKIHMTTTGSQLPVARDGRPAHRKVNLRFRD